MNQYVSSLVMHFPLHEFKPSASLHEKQGRLFSSRTRAAGRVTAAGTPPLTAPASSRGGTDQHSVTSIIQAAFCQLQASVKQSARSRSWRQPALAPDRCKLPQEQFQTRQAGRRSRQLGEPASRRSPAALSPPRALPPWATCRAPTARG